MTKTRFLTLVMALALLLAIPTAAFAQRVPPHIFVGSATLDGTTAVDGAAVTAWIDGEQVAATHAAGGEYTLLVDQEDSSFSGKTVSFKISCANAAETATKAKKPVCESQAITDCNSYPTIRNNMLFTRKEITSQK